MPLIENLTLLNNNKAKKGDSPQQAVRSEIINALIDTVSQLARGENFGRGHGIRKRSGQGTLTLTANETRSRFGSNTKKTPFQVYKAADNSSPPYPILKVYPGRIGVIMPTLANAKLDVPDTSPGLHPWFYPPNLNTSFSMFLRIHLLAKFPVPQNYRSHIDEVKVVSDDDPLAVPDIDPMTGEVPELLPVWEGADDGEKALKTKGHFYIKLADITMGADPSIITIQQFLYQQFLTFVISGDQVIALN